MTSRKTSTKPWSRLRPDRRQPFGSPVELNIENPAQLENYLQQRGEKKINVSKKVEVLHGGVSNRTVRVCWSDGDSWVLKQALSQLRVEVDWFSPPERIFREAAGIEYLPRWLPGGCVPRLVFLDREHHLLAMEAVPDPHENWKARLMRGEVAPDLVVQFGKILAALHLGSSGDPEGREVFADRFFFESLRVEPYYGYSAKQVGEASGFLCELMEATNERRDCVVHGDYSPKNLLVHKGRLILLDHEVIHLGDPAFDVGFSMTHLLSKAHHVAGRRAAFREAARLYWDTYSKGIRDLDAGEKFESRCVRHTLACLLARVDGRSPLEYLTEAEKSEQRRVSLLFMSATPNCMPELIDEFCNALSSCQ